MDAGWKPNSAAGVVRALVTASPEVRAHRLAEQQGLDLGEAKKSIERSDRGRAAYLKSFYGVDRELPIHYDLVLNTDRLSTAIAAALRLPRQPRGGR